MVGSIKPIAGAAQIEDSYHAHLGRDADPGGLNTWENALAQGQSFAQVDGEIAQSPEAAAYAAKPKSPAAEFDQALAELQVSFDIGSYQ